MRFIKLSGVAALGLCGLLLAGVSGADESSKPVAVVNGVPIPQARMDFVVKMQTQQGQKDTPEFRKQVRDVLITREVIAQKALKEGLDKSPEFQAQLDLARQQLLVQGFLENYLNTHEPTEADLKAEYERVKKAQYDPDSKEYKARHILVKTEKEAKDILAQLKKGAKFADLAKKKSIDTGTNQKGGELDWTDGANMVKPFAEAMRSLKKGETSGPVKTPYGWHIIHIDDVRTPQFPTFEQVKDQVSKQYLAKQRDELIESLRKQAKIEE
ncbi:MAG: peptidylprolyl isomerase [Betaproteobacteria bacterium]|nr:peptidylprolyl isomerase [Betaproteobacteria bacterium]